MKSTTTGPFAPSAPKADVCTFTSCTMSGLGTAIDVQSQPSSIMLVPSINSAVPPRYGAPEIDTPLPILDPTEPPCVKSVPPCAPLAVPFGVTTAPGGLKSNSVAFREIMG